MRMELRHTEVLLCISSRRRRDESGGRKGGFVGFPMRVEVRKECGSLGGAAGGW